MTASCAVLEVPLVQHYHATHRHCNSTPWWSHLPNRSSHPNPPRWSCSRHARTVVAAGATPSLQLSSPETLAVMVAVAAPYHLSRLKTLV